MTVNVRKRRRKIDPDHAKKKAIKKAGKTALEVGSSVIRPVGTSGAAEVLKGALKKGKKKKKKQVIDTDYLYGDWLDSPSKAAKKKRQRITGVDERDV